MLFSLPWEDGTIKIQHPCNACNNPLLILLSIKIFQPFWFIDFVIIRYKILLNLLSI